MTLEEKASAYLSGRPGFTESRKTDIKDLLTLVGVDKVSQVSNLPGAAAAFERLLDQLILRGEPLTTRAAAEAEADAAAGSRTIRTPSGTYQLDPFAVQSAIAAYHRDDSDYALQGAIEAYFTTAMARNLPLPMKVIPGGVDGYAPLADVLRDAYEQSAIGKGKERHANGKPFLMQPIMSIGRMVGPGYPLGQAMKKSQEAGGMFARGNTPAAKAELLGVIVYTAAAIILMTEQENKT